MSRDLAHEDYYISHGGQVPVKWTAPEVCYNNTLSLIFERSLTLYCTFLWCCGRSFFPLNFRLCISGNTPLLVMCGVLGL